MNYKKIKSLKQYNEYCAIHEKLFLTDYKKDQDDIELLEILIEEYDSRIQKIRIKELNPVELLSSLIENANYSQKEFAQEINISRQLLSDVLNYRRNISKDLVLKLSKFFSMSQEAFGRQYDLQKPKSSNSNQALLSKDTIPKSSTRKSGKSTPTKSEKTVVTRKKVSANKRKPSAKIKGNLPEESTSSSGKTSR